MLGAGPNLIHPALRGLTTSHRGGMFPHESAVISARVPSLVMLALVSSGASQVRDTSGAPGGTGVIAGRLVAANTGGPVRAAQVTLEGDARRLITTSDDVGGFVFTGVAAGRYVLSAARTGFVGVRFGEKRPGYGGPGGPIVLAAGQRIEGLTLAMPRASVITGVVVDEFGEPAMGAQVQVRRYVTVGGRRTLIGAGRAEVDDRGLYRVFPLPPGEYVVAAMARSGASMNEAFQAGAAAFARVGSQGAPAASPPIMVLTVRPDPDGPPKPGYVPAYHPAGTTVSAAVPILLGLSEERTGVDVRLQRVMLSRVSGTVRSADGGNPRVELRLSPAVVAGPSENVESVRTATVDRDGTFAFADIGPGEYTISARGHTAPGRGSSETLWARRAVSVSGAHVNDLHLILERGIPVSGVVVGDHRALSENTINVVFTPAGESRFFSELAGRSYKPVGLGGRFATSSLAPGQYDIALMPEIPGWRLASAVFGGRDALDFLLDIRPGESPTGVLTLGLETELSGTLVDESGSPADAYTIVVFATDEQYWLPGNRRNQAVIPDAQGRFTFLNLPPGTYRLAVVEDFDAIAGIDATLLRQLTASATVLVTLADGERKVQDLRVQ